MEDIDIGNPELISSMFYTALAPIIWTFVAQMELKTNIFTKLFCKNKRAAVASHAALITTIMLLRTFAFERAIEVQPKLLIESSILDFVSLSMIFGGLALSTFSYIRLGILGVYYADYFGIKLFDGPLTHFPFNVCDDPMYWGATAFFFGIAIFYRSPTGVFLAC